jgi:hypothetical protein
MSNMRWLDRLEARINADPTDRVIARAVGVTIAELKATNPMERIDARLGAQIDRERRAQLNSGGMVDVRE